MLIPRHMLILLLTNRHHNIKETKILEERTMADLPNLSLLCLQVADRPSNIRTTSTSQESYDLISGVKEQMWNYFNFQTTAVAVPISNRKEPRVSDTTSDSHQFQYQLGIAMSALALR